MVSPDPAHYDGQQTSSGSMDLDEFTCEVSRLMGLAYPDENITFTEDEPLGNSPDGISAPVITFDTHERTRSKSHKSLDPIHFDTIPDPDYPDYHIKLYRMWFDVEMDFNVYATTNRKAKQLMNLFEEFLFTYKGYFKDSGISDIIFLAETKPKVESRWNMELACRNLRYLVRIERITTVRSYNLKKVNLVVDPITVDEDIEPQNHSTPFIDHYNSINRPK
jgi:hypothetical protein